MAGEPDRLWPVAQQGLVADIRLDRWDPSSQACLSFKRGQPRRLLGARWPSPDRHFTEGHDNAAKAIRLRTATLMFIGLHNGRGWLL
jgi:hypothetical protein